jgi:hypothetical protein
MEIAWTTVLIIALLLPGVLFLVGYSNRERYSREVVKSSAIGEVAGAFLIAVLIHLAAWGLLSLFGFDLASNIKQVADYDSLPRWLLIDHITRRVPYVVAYIVLTAIAGLLVGWGVGWLIVQGFLPFLATHKWINVVIRSMNEGLVTAYVMTTIVENNRILMYKGVLAEFYLSPDGKFTYIVLKTCSRYYMKLEDAAPITSTQLQLFDERKERPEGSWEYLLIDGMNIANILFDPSPQIVESPAGEQALEAALNLLRAATAEIRSTGTARP